MKNNSEIQLDSMQNEVSNPTKVLYRTALWTVWLGALIALVAVLYNYSYSQSISWATLIMSALALVVSFPVYRKYHSMNS